MKRNLVLTLFIVCLLCIGMAAADRGFRFAYVANQGSNTVSVIDRAINSIVATIGGIPAPGGVAVTHDGKEVWVVAANEIDVIDTATNTVASTFALNNPGLIFPNSVVFGPLDFRAYVVNDFYNAQGNGTVSVIDRYSHALLATIVVGEGPRCIAISPNGKRVYVTNGEDGTVSVIDTTTLTVVTTIPNFIGTAYGLAVTPDGKYVYAMGSTLGIVVIDTATNNITTTISPTLIPGYIPCNVAITPNGKFAYVTACGANSVVVVDTKLNTIVDTIPVGTPTLGPVYGVAIGPFGRYVYVTSSPTNDVYVIDTSSNTVVDTIAVGGDPYGIAVRPLP